MFNDFPQEHIPNSSQELWQIAPGLPCSNAEIPSDEKTAPSSINGTWSNHMLAGCKDYMHNVGPVDTNYIDEVLVELGLPGLLSVGSIQATDSASTGSDCQELNVVEAQSSSKPRKFRRRKPQIELAPGQPLTTQGKTRSRVYVACLQCRTRKIRCDGAKPVCHNCNRYANSECEYDSLPKRRGPDRTPGARQRVIRDLRNHLTDGARTRKRPRAQADNNSITSPTNLFKCGCHNAIYCPALVDNAGFPFVNELETPQDLYYHAITSLNNAIDNGPSLIFTRRVWWDSLLSLYISSIFARHEHITPTQRDVASRRIISDLRFTFRVSGHWFSFFHIPTFFANLCDPVQRESVQPCLVLALLAMAIFLQSSEVELGDEGRMRALRFRDEAQAALEASISTRWIDETVVQAAWVLAFFEISAHPEHSGTRASSSLNLLDSLIRSLSLTLIDVNDSDTSLFTPGSVPVLTWSCNEASSNLPDWPMHHTSTNSAPDTGCGCNAITLESNWPLTNEHVPLWGLTPAWNVTWTASEIRKESCRRLCWSSMTLAAGHVSYITASQVNPVAVPDLFISNPANYALLFSGESITRSPAFSLYPSPKDTMWALNERSHLLWHSCARMRSDMMASDAEKARFAVKAWLEADVLEAALNRHTCKVERGFLYHARECIFNTKMCISHEYQRWVPLATTDTNGLFHRGKAEEWLTHEAIVARGLVNGLHTVTGINGNSLFRRPFFIFWFMAQINRAISLWEYDQTLVTALDVCKAFITVIDYLTSLWPCPDQRLAYGGIRQKIDHACRLAGVCPPPPWNLNVV